jgi:hypothetical protein
MRFSIHPNGPAGPCRHMEGLLNREADGTANPWQRWYALAHALRCTRCRRYLEALQAMVDRLRAHRDEGLSQEMRGRLEDALRAASSEIS